MPPAILARARTFTVADAAFATLPPLAALLLLATTVHAEAPSCEPAWREGYLRGVADIEAQLTASHAEMEKQVERQLNAQLAQLQSQRDADLKTQIRSAQEAALEAAVATPMPPALTGATSAAADPALPPAADAAATPLAPGSRLVIENAERLPPDLLAQLLAFSAGG